MQQLVDTGEYLLVPVRGFYYAYGSGAFALSRPSMPPSTGWPMPSWASTPRRRRRMMPCTF